MKKSCSKLPKCPTNQDNLFVKGFKKSKIDF